MLVQELEFSLKPGLTAITGESGAGKSILMDALSLVLGSRASRLATRPGTSQCEVVAEFELPEVEAVLSLMDANQWTDEDNPTQCIVRRTVTSDGRSRAWINATPVNVGALRQLCSPLVEVHGQFTQQRLSDPAVQLEWLDDYGSNPQLVNQVATAYSDWREQNSQLEQLASTLENQRQRIELLNYQIEELDELELGASEFELLTRRHKRIAQAHDTKSIVATALSSLGESVYEELVRVRKALETIEDDNPSLNNVQAVLQDTDVHIDESRMELQRYLDSLNFDPQELERVEFRLDRIHSTARKHRVQSNELYAHAKRLREELDSLRSDETELQQLRNNVNVLANKYSELATQLHDIRVHNAPRFIASVRKTLAQIALSHVALNIDFADAENFRGMDAIEYMIATNEEFEPMPMRRIASGGEMARIALALMVVVAKKSRLPCLVLDEADIGVGGVTADTIGRMLRELAAHTQIICVTHAPQVAALADNHLCVSRDKDDEISINAMKDEDRVSEIARMVGGQEINSESREYARSLLNGARC